MATHTLTDQSKPSYQQGETMGTLRPCLDDSERVSGLAWLGLARTFVFYIKTCMDQVGNFHEKNNEEYIRQEETFVWVKAANRSYASCKCQAKPVILGVYLCIYF